MELADCIQNLTHSPAEGAQIKSIKHCQTDTFWEFSDKSHRRIHAQRMKRFPDRNKKKCINGKTRKHSWGKLYIFHNIDQQKCNYAVNRKVWLPSNTIWAQCWNEALAINRNVTSFFNISAKSEFKTFLVGVKLALTRLEVKLAVGFESRGKTVTWKTWWPFFLKKKRPLFERESKTCNNQKMS